MGLSSDDAESTVRFSLGYATTQRDIDIAIEATASAARRLREAMSASLVSR